jgi:hypothetical protein
MLLANFTWVAKKTCHRDTETQSNRGKSNDRNAFAAGVNASNWNRAFVALGPALGQAPDVEGWSKIETESM